MPIVAGPIPIGVALLLSKNLFNRFIFAVCVYECLRFVIYEKLCVHV